MSRMGSLAAEDEYGFSDLGIPVGASQVAPPLPTEQADPAGFAMGALANYRDYAPFKGSIATGATPWKKAEVEAARGDEIRDVTLGDPATAQFLGELMVPTEPWEVALSAITGPVGKGVAALGGKALKTGIMTGGIMGSDVQEADASIFGRMSKLADPAMFGKAERLLKRGVDPAEVKFQTGLERGVDGKLRGEISDARSSLIPGGEGFARDLLDHPELYKHYPSAGDVWMSIGKEKPPEPGIKGAYYEPTEEYPGGKIYSYQGNKEPLSTVLHELGGHHVQREEGFARGANPFSDEVDKVARDRKAAEIVDAQEAYDRLAATREEWMQAYLDKHGGSLTKMDDFFRAKKAFEKEAPDYNKYMDEIFAKWQQPMRRTQADLYNAYYDWAGEVEARNVQRRMLMDDEQLRSSLMSETADRSPGQQIVKSHADPRRAIPAPSFDAGPPPEGMGSILKAATISRGPQRGVLTADDFVTAAPIKSAPPELTNAYRDPRLHAKAEKIWNTYPQYGEAYPEVGPPALKEKAPDPKNPGKWLIAPKKGEIPYSSMEEALAKAEEDNFFLEKKLTPEAMQFQKDRNAVQRDMDLHGYPKYFDPAKRTDIPASDYGPFTDTAVAASPKSAKTDAEWTAKYGTPEARARLQEGYAKGKSLGNAENWYYMKQLQDKYVEVLGEKAGKEAFKREFSGMMAATTGGASPYNNWLMSQYAGYLNKRGQRVDQRAYEMPFPIGGRFASGNMDQAQKYIDAGMVGFDPAKNPKRYDFDNALAGDRNAGVIDEQMSGAFIPGMTIPDWYGTATKILREEAAKAGTDPRAFQDVGWAGLKAMKTEAAAAAAAAKRAKAKPGVGHNSEPFEFDYEGPMIDQINRSIETTHRLTGMPIEEIVVRGVIKKEIPMYGLGGAAAMGALAEQGKYSTEERM